MSNYPVLPKETGSILRNVFGMHKMPGALQSLVVTGNIHDPSSIQWSQSINERAIDTALGFMKLPSKSNEMKKVLYLYMIIGLCRSIFHIPVSEHDKWVAHSYGQMPYEPEPKYDGKYSSKEEYNDAKKRFIIKIIKYAELNGIIINENDIISFIPKDQKPLVTGAIMDKDKYQIVSPSSAAAATASASASASGSSSSSNNNNTSLFTAIENGNILDVQTLLDRGANVNIQHKDGYTPLIVAAANGHELIVKMLLDNGADVNLQDNKYGNTPLIVAADYGHESIVKMLLDKDATVDLQDKKGNTPLIAAAVYGFISIVKMLLDKGANMNLQNEDGNTPLIFAADNKHESIVKMLQSSSASAPPMNNSSGYYHPPSAPPMNNSSNITASLSNAVRKGNESNVRTLLDKGANINKQNRSGWTPLITAVFNKVNSIVEILLTKGADVNLQNNLGQTALMMAVFIKDESIVRLLLANGADVNLKDNKGDTAISIAAKMGNKPMVMILKEAYDRSHAASAPPPVDPSLPATRRRQRIFVPPRRTHFPDRPSPSSLPPHPLSHVHNVLPPLPPSPLPPRSPLSKVDTVLPPLPPGPLPPHPLSKVHNILPPLSAPSHTRKRSIRNRKQTRKLRNLKN